MNKTKNKTQIKRNTHPQTYYNPGGVLLLRGEAPAPLGVEVVQGAGSVTTCISGGELNSFNSEGVWGSRRGVRLGLDEKGEGSTARAMRN